MKSIFKLSALALLATAMTVSCEKEMAVEDVVAHQMESHTFTLAFAQPDTKVAVTNEGKTTWEVGDEIMIHGGTDGKLRQKVTLTADDISADGKKATITFEMDPYDRTDAGVVSKFYAQYPASLVPEGSMYYECRFTGTNDFLMAACDVNDTFVFYNLCGIIAFEATGEFDRFVFSGNGGETVGYSSVYQVRVRLDNGKDAPSVNYYKPGNGSGDPVPMKEFAADLKDGVNYIFLPTGANFTEGFNFKFYDGEDLVKVAKTTSAVDVAVGKILALGNINDKLEDFVPPTTSDHEPAAWAASATDLSVGGQAPANTYVLTAPGAYKIPAVKGNTTEPVGNVFDAELVWETYNNTEEVVKNSIIAEVDFDNDNLYFKTTDSLKPGNALIAVKDYEGKIIWSWHIWIPSTAITTVEANGMFGTAVMDRNLGALTAVGTAATAESAGFLYQWGRKDPFMGVGAMSANTSTKMTTTGDFTKSKEQISLTTAIANPTMFAFNGETAVDPTWKGLNWCTADNSDAWGTAEAKGVYDPCPAGYRVPAYNNELAGWATADWTYDEANFFYKYSDAIFPFAGYLDDCSGSLSHGGDRSAFWSATAYDADRGRSVDVRFKSGSASHSVTSQYKARGNSVRCVKIDGWVEPVQPSTTKVDVLNNANTILESTTTYADWKTETFESGATYVGNSAGDASTIQLRSDVKNGMYAGFVSTTTGGLVKKVKVTWNTKTTATRYLDIFVSNTAYTSTSDLYDNFKRGTLLTTLTYASADAASFEVEVPGDYAYIGIRSRKSAQYLDSVEITWEPGTPAADGSAPSYNWDFSDAKWQALFAEKGAAGSDLTGWNINYDGMQVVSIIDKSKYQTNCFQMGGKVNVVDNVVVDRYFTFTAPVDGYVMVVASNTGETPDESRKVTVANNGATEDKVGGVASTDPVSLVYAVKAGKVLVYPTGNGLRFYKILFSQTDPTPVPEPAFEHQWGWYSAGDGSTLWTANVTAISVTHPDGYGMVRGLAMDDEYIYLPKASAYPAIAAVKITDPNTQVKGDVSTVDAGDTFKSSFVRMMKNTDASVNGGKDVLLMSNLSAANGGNIVIYAYTNGIESAPIKLAQFAWDSANNVEDWRRYGDRFFVTGTWQDGKIWLPSFNPMKMVCLSVANGARTAVTQFAATEEVSPSGIKDVVVWEGTDTQYLLMNNDFANLVVPTGNKQGNGWDELTLNFAVDNAKGTWGYNFFKFNDKDYIAYARLNGKKACIEIIEAGVNLGRAISAPQVFMQIPIHSAASLDSELTTGGLADCCVRVINGVPYIAALTRDGALTVYKLVMK